MKKMSLFTAKYFIFLQVLHRDSASEVMTSVREILS